MPSPRMERARELAQERRLRSDLKEQLSGNQTDIYILNARELTGVWVNLQKDKNLSDEETASLFEELTGFTLNFLSSGITQVRRHQLSS